MYPARDPSGEVRVGSQVTPTAQSTLFNMTERELPRRAVLRGGLAAASLATLPAMAAAQDSAPAAASKVEGSKRRFKLNYAPHFGMFKNHAGDDVIDQLKFMADEGFTALEDNWMTRRKPEMQDRIGQALRDLGMTMGVFVAHAKFDKPTFSSDDPELRKLVDADILKTVETAKRVDAKWVTVVPGSLHRKDPIEYQTARAIDNLRRVADVLDPAGITAVLEPLNPFTDHPGCFLSGIPQAYAICRGVNRPSIKILDDLYHQQITEGNLIPNLNRAWSEIAYIQVGDNPGRKEPTTGEINYKNVFRHLHRKGYQGVIGMEHGNSRGGKDGERAVIDAYAEVDSFA